MFTFFHRRPPAPPSLPRLLSYQAANLQGIGTRPNQEDSFALINALDVTAIRQQGLMAIVADGMGGMENGKAISQDAVSLLAQRFQQLDRATPLGPQLRDHVLAIGKQLFEHYQGNSGTTLVACVLFDQKLDWVSIGDSFLYLKRRDGVCRLNHDHNHQAELSMQAIRNGRLTAAAAVIDPDGHRLSQFLGKQDIEQVNYSCRPLTLQNGDRLLLCSDGVGGVLSPEDLLPCLQADPERACAHIEAGIMAANRSYQDNYTAVVLSCDI